MSILTKFPGCVRLGTFNVCCMLDFLNDPTTSDGVRGKSAKSMEAVADVLLDSEADIVSLQEVENIEILQKLLEIKGLKEVFPYHALIEGNDKYKGFDVAVISRFPIIGQTTHKERVISESEGRFGHFKRDLLQVEIQLPFEAKTLRLFSAHFVSQVPQKQEVYDQWRQSEAKAAVEIVKEQSEKYPVSYSVVLGDFNGGEDSEVMKIFDREPSLHNATLGLPSTWGLLQPTQYEPTSLDHILVDDLLKERVVGRGVFSHPQAAEASDHSLLWADCLVA